MEKKQERKNECSENTDFEVGRIAEATEEVKANYAADKVKPQFILSLPFRCFKTSCNWRFKRLIFASKPTQSPNLANQTHIIRNVILHFF